MWSPCTISSLLIHGSIATGAILDELASHFARVSRSDHYSQTFQLTKVMEKSRVIDSSTARSDDYNYPSLFLNYGLLSPVVVILLQGQIKSVTQY